MKMNEDKAWLRECQVSVYLLIESSPTFKKNQKRKIREFPLTESFFFYIYFSRTDVRLSIVRTRRKSVERRLE